MRVNVTDGLVNRKVRWNSNCPSMHFTLAKRVRNAHEIRKCGAGQPAGRRSDIRRPAVTIQEYRAGAETDNLRLRCRGE